MGPKSEIRGSRKNRRGAKFCTLQNFDPRPKFGPGQISTPEFGDLGYPRDPKEWVSNGKSVLKVSQQIPNGGPKWAPKNPIFLKMTWVKNYEHNF